MSWTKRNSIICDMCGLFCRPVDSYTPYGCSNYDAPEPLDEEHICKKCEIKLKKQWLVSLKHGRYGDWQKSKAEIWAAKKLGLIWDNSNFKYILK